MSCFRFFSPSGVQAKRLGFVHLISRLDVCRICLSWVARLGRSAFSPDGSACTAREERI